MTIQSRLKARAYKLPPRLNDEIRIEANVPVTMRDGVVLLGNRYYAPQAPHQPVILIRTPYGRAMGAMAAQLFAERGFQVFVQSCRGTSGSGGSFDPLRQEPEDGLDTLDWLERQPWGGGKIFTFGLSYLGFVQWAIAKDAGDRIAGMGLQFTLSNFRNEVLAFGGHSLECAFGWGSMMASMIEAKSLFDLLLIRMKGVDPKLYQHLPLRDLDKLAHGKEIPWWRDWMAHPEPSDPWWDKINFTKSIPEVEIPATMIAGWHDLFLPWQVKDFEIMQARGRDAWLTIGPWHHIAEGGMAESIRQSLALFSALEKGERPFQDRDRVRLYIMGAETWAEYPSWPPPNSREQTLYLHANGALDPNEQAQAQEQEPSKFVYDPAEPTPSLHPPSPFSPPKKIRSMAALERRGDTLCFTASPLDAPLDVIGPVFADIHLRSSREHTDLYACLCDVDDRGLSVKVCDGFLRLRPDDVSQDENGVRKVEVEFAPTAYRFQRGHRLRLIIASGAHPRFARNLGSGEPLGAGERMVQQMQEVFHDGRYRSALRLCVSGEGNT